MTARPLSSVLKCFSLLETLAARPEPSRLADLARMTGESRATTYQRLLTLTEARWVERLPNGSYRLSLGVCRLANLALEQAGLGERALPAMQALTEATGETSSLVVLENDRVVIAQRVESRGVLRADLRVGSEVSFLESASGQIWSAFGPPGLVERLRAQGRPVISDARLAEIRRDGYAIAGGGETLQGIAGVGMPILSESGDCLASLSLFGPDTRFEPQTALPAVREAAKRLADILAGHPGFQAEAISTPR